MIIATFAPACCSFATGSSTFECKSQSRAAACFPAFAPVSIAVSQCSRACSVFDCINLATAPLSKDAMRWAMRPIVAMETLCACAISRYGVPRSSASTISSSLPSFSRVSDCCTAVCVCIALLPTATEPGVGAGGEAIAVVSGVESEDVVAGAGEGCGVSVEGDPSAVLGAGDEDGVPADGAGIGAEGRPKTRDSRVRGNLFTSVRDTLQGFSVGV